jgi:hypothetical protein
MPCSEMYTPSVIMPYEELEDGVFTSGISTQILGDYNVEDN